MRGRPLHVLLVKALSAAVGLAYIAAGVFLLAASSNPLGLAGPIRLAFGLLLCLYGSYRFVRGARRTPALI